MTNWKAGMKAVCVIAKPLSNTPGPHPPLILGHVYTVRRVLTCECGLTVLDVGLLGDDFLALSRCSCGHVLHSESWPVSSIRFRPLITDDIAEEMDRIESEVVTEEVEQYETLEV